MGFLRRTYEKAREVAGKVVTKGLERVVAPAAIAGMALSSMNGIPSAKASNPDYFTNTYFMIFASIGGFGSGDPQPSRTFYVNPGETNRINIWAYVPAGQDMMGINYRVKADTNWFIPLGARRFQMNTNSSLVVTNGIYYNPPRTNKMSSTSTRFRGPDVSGNYVTNWTMLDSLSVGTNGINNGPKVDLLAWLDFKAPNSIANITTQVVDMFYAEVNVYDSVLGQIVTYTSGNPDAVRIYDSEVVFVPEPSTLALTGLGLGALIGYRNRRRKIMSKKEQGEVVDEIMSSGGGK